MHLFRRIASLGLLPGRTGRESRPPSRSLPIEPKVLYLEVSYRCNLKCAMCTRHVEGVPQVFMTQEVFERALPDLVSTDYVFLVGWGEPLLSPQAVEFLRALKGADFTRGFSTNGLLLEGEIAEGILEEGAYSVNVSIDAGCAETYHRIRGRDRFDELLETLRSFIRLRERMGSPTRLTWVFVIMKSNFRELPRAIELASEIGVDQFAAKHLESARSREGLSEALYDTGYAPPPKPEELEELDRVLLECENIAEGRIPLQVHPVVHGSDFWGLHEPFFKLFMDHRGYVTPCAFISPQDTKPYTGKPFDDRWILGNVRDLSIREMTASRKWVDFQETWLSGGVPSACEGCLRLSRMTEDRLCHAL